MKRFLALALLLPLMSVSYEEGRQFPRVHVRETCALKMWRTRMFIDRFKAKLGQYFRNALIRFFKFERNIANAPFIDDRECGYGAGHI